VLLGTEKDETEDLRKMLKKLEDQIDEEARRLRDVEDKRDKDL
jgi:hypothetical protein